MGIGQTKAETARRPVCMVIKSKMKQKIHCRIILCASDYMGIEDDLRQKGRINVMRYQTMTLIPGHAFSSVLGTGPFSESLAASKMR